MMIMIMIVMAKRRRMYVCHPLLENGGWSIFLNMILFSEKMWQSTFDFFYFIFLIFILQNNDELGVVARPLSFLVRLFDHNHFSRGCQAVSFHRRFVARYKCCTPLILFVLSVHFLRRYQCEVKSQIILIVSFVKL